MMDKRYNCHTHVFTGAYVPALMLRDPKNAIDRRIMEEFDKAYNAKGIFLPTLFKDIESNIFDKSALDIQNLSQRIEKIVMTLLNFLLCDMDDFLDELEQVYAKHDPDSEWVFCILTMNFDHGVYKNHKGFSKQARETLFLKKKYPGRVLVFYAIDPRDKNIDGINQEFINEKQIDGFKIYPPLGFFPNDPRLEHIYALAEKNSIPITAHCAYPHKVCYSLSEKLYGVDPANTEQLLALLVQMTAPSAWKSVLDTHPNLHLNLAHFGDPISRDSWSEEIVEMINSGKYPYLYTDISYCYDCLPAIKKMVLENPSLSERLLYGSDFFIQVFGINEEDFLRDVKQILGTSLYDKITIENPRRFLFQQIH